MASENQAYLKGRKIIRSCKTAKHVFSAYNWIWLFKTMYGKTSRWEKLLNYCTQRRNGI